MSSRSRFYLWQGVAFNARTLAFLLRDLPLDSPRWDARPDPNRFSLREIVAHLLDYDSVSRERMEHMIRENVPELPNWDEDAAAAHYDVRDPKHQIENLLVSRQELSVWLEGLSGDEWERRGLHPKAGEVSVSENVALMLGHDAYHLEQIVAWLDATK